MSLKVWLPLNGNLNNQGLSNIKVVNENTTISTSGKLGNCYEFNGSTSRITIDYLDAFRGNSNQFTYCCWIYDNDNAGRSVYFGDYGTTGAIGVNIEKNTSNKVRFYWNGSPDKVFNAVIPNQQWVHLAITYDGSIIKCYLNGILQDSLTQILSTKNKTSGFYGIGRDSRSDTTAFKGMMNDFRIYDECLSSKQIKEIAKGLVCHYKMNGVGANPNLLVNAYTPTAWTYESCTKISDLNPYIIGFTTSAANQRIYLGVSNVWTSGQKYVYSFDAKASIVNATIDASRSIADFGPTHYLTTDWKHYSGIINSTLTAEAGTLSIRGKTSGVTYYIKNVKLEKGEISTSWIPNEADNLYTSLGYANNICTDDSGFNYNATKIGTLTFNSDSPRYDGSIHVDGSSYLQIISPSTEVRTISLWVKWDSIPSGQSVVYVDYKSRTGLGLMSSGILCSSGGISSKTFSKTNIVANTWYHFVIINPGDANTSADRDLYINGVKQTPTTSTSNWTLSIDYLQIGKRSTTSDGFVGQISDFRMYAIALSMEEILTLYKNSGIIDNNGNIYTREFKEV